MGDLYDEHVYGVVTPDRRFKVDVNPSGSVVMIRCDIKKGKQPLQQSLNKPPWDAAPRAADGFVLDLGNIGFRGGSSQYPQIRGDNYVEADPLSLQSAGPPQTRIFRNIQQPTTIGTSLATASRTSTDSTSTPGRSRKGQRPRMGGIVHCGAFFGSTVIRLCASSRAPMHCNVCKTCKPRCTLCTFYARTL